MAKRKQNMLMDSKITFTVIATQSVMEFIQDFIEIMSYTVRNNHLKIPLKSYSLKNGFSRMGCVCPCVLDSVIVIWQISIHNKN